MKLLIDLCSGLGGMCQAFKDSSEWKVITVDIEPKFIPTICKDVKLLIQDKEFMALRPEIILASPPCTFLSRAAGLGMIREGTGEALRITAAICDIIYAMQPKGFVIENPDTGYMRFFLGKPNARIRLNAYRYVSVKPTALWTNLNLPLVPFDTPRANPDQYTWENHNSKNPELRARMPIGLSKAVLEAVSQ